MAISLMVASASSAGSLTALSTFGGSSHVGWRAPNEVLAGDSAGSSTAGNYNYLTSIAGSQYERGFAYDPATTNLILVSRNTVGPNSGANVRVLSGTTGADLRGLNNGSGIVTGGTYPVNHVGVSGDGAIYVSNLTTNAFTTAHRIYQWTDDLGVVTPNVYLNQTYASGSFTGGAGRLGDDFHVFGSGANTVMAAGVSGAIGYDLITQTSLTSGNGTAITAASQPPTSGLSIGITFAGSSTAVWGKLNSTSNPSLFETTNDGTAITSSSTVTLTGGNPPIQNEGPMDYTVINGTPYLATLDTGYSTTALNAGYLRVYDVTNPTSPVLVAIGNNTVGTLTTDGNKVGNVAWGAIDNVNATATVYALGANQGIEAFTFTVPEPTSLGLLGMTAAGLLARRSRRKA